MPKLSEELSRMRGGGDRFPRLHIDGYAGEQDGDVVVRSDEYMASSLAEADRLYPALPGWCEVAWAEYDPRYGWTWVLGQWRSKIPDDGRFPVERR